MTEKRKFRRYQRTSDFLLEYKGKNLGAKMLDYSLEGLRLKVEGSVPIREGETVFVSGTSPQIITSGKVMWINRREKEQMLGIKNKGLLRGCLEDFNLADTLLGLQMSQKTGVLRVELGEILRKIYVSGGDMIFSTSNLEQEHMGAMLVREGLLSHEQYECVLQEIEDTGQRMGRVLVSQGLMTPREVWKVVRRQIEGIILNLFALEEGVFAFEEIALPAEELITLKLSVANIIYNGTKRINNLKRIGRALPSPQSILYFSSDPLNLFQNLRLDRAGQKVVSCLNGTSTIKDVIEITGLNDMDALKTIYALLSTRIIEVMDEEEPSIDLSQEEIQDIFAPRAEPGIVKMIEDMYLEHERLGYYRVLGISGEAPESEIKKAYYAAAKKFHPDIHFSLSDDSLKYKLSHIFSYIHRAYTTLSDPRRRREYDESLTLKPARLSSKQDMAREKFNHGRDLYQKRRYVDAEMLLRQALYIDGFQPEYHYYHGLALFEQARHSEAKKALEEAVRLDPVNSEYLADLGRVLLKMGSPTRARVLFSRALKISKDNKTASEGLEKMKRS